jgi:3-hydroxymyristoyl/3-hydroxydecanoyl-(acyl carrier protein) dehydratase
MSAILANPQTAPVVLSVQQTRSESADEVELSLQVHRGLRWFEGHFPEVPLLPGVVQTAWVIEFARAYLPIAPHFRSMHNMKFMRFIMPGSTIRLWLRYQRDKNELAFEYSEAEKISASGKIRFGE